MRDAEQIKGWKSGQQVYPVSRATLVTTVRRGKTRGTLCLKQSEEASNGGPRSPRHAHPLRCPAGRNPPSLALLAPSPSSSFLILFLLPACRCSSKFPSPRPPPQLTWCTGAAEPRVCVSGDGRRQGAAAGSEGVVELDITGIARLAQRTTGELVVMAVLSRGKSMIDSLIMGETTLKEFFGGKSVAEKPHLERNPSGTRKWIKELSSLANVVVGHCARILLLLPEELQRHFEEEAPVSAKHPSKYARHLLEYSCFRALSVAAQVTDHLSDKEFRRLSFDMMLAWEAPGATNRPVVKSEPESSSRDSRAKDEEDAAFFYSDLMPMMVDVESTVGLDAFARIAPAIPTVADAITVHSQFEALTATTGGRLPFPIYDKYVSELDKSIKSIKNQLTPSLLKALHLGKGETVIDIDGTATTQPVLQHVGVSTWPGRLTLTDYAFYFEATGVVSYDKPKKFDLSADLKHVVKPDLTGPWGARLFDKAVMYKSSVTVDPVVLEFPELTGRTRRDYWLAIIREVVAAHQFIHTYQLEGVGNAEALAKAVLGIARLRATKETFHVLPPRPESLLTYSLGAEMPGGDLILAELANLLRNTGHVDEKLGGESYRGSKVYASSAAAVVASFGPKSPKGIEKSKESPVPIGEILIGEITPLEKAIVQSRDNTKKVLLAQATIEGVKVEGIGTNVAVMKELLVPLLAVITWLQTVFAWEEPSKSLTFCAFGCYIIYKGWLSYLPPAALALLAAYMAYVRHMRNNNNEPIKEVIVSTPPNQNTVEQLLALQQALSQLESLIQAGNIFLLKTRALILSAFPEATDQVIMLLCGLAAALLILPIRWLVLITFLNVFTSEMPVRAEFTRRFTRRISEWWYGIPVVPVRFLKPQERENSPK